jgi:uncharacterized protein (DUF302 family)
MLVVRNTSAYGFGVTSSLPFAETIDTVKTALAAEGFGVVSEIDVREKLCDSLGASVPPYTILGVCNPHFALHALKEEAEIGLLMPCNVLVRADGPRVQVSVMNPYLLIRMTENSRLRGLSDEVFFALERALERFAKSTQRILVAA